MPPKAQVQVRCDQNYAAVNLPLGDQPAEVDAQPAGKLHAAAEQHQAARAQATAGTMPPKVHAQINGETKDAVEVRVSQASLDGSRSPLSSSPLECTSLGTMKTPGQATHTREKLDKSKVDLLEAEEAEKTAGCTSLSN